LTGYSQVTDPGLFHKVRSVMTDALLENPELIKSSIYDDDVILFYKFYEYICEGKYICVVMNLCEEIVITSYITNKRTKSSLTIVFS
jgi:hypothetical protein